MNEFLHTNYETEGACLENGKRARDSFFVQEPEDSEVERRQIASLRQAIFSMPEVLTADDTAAEIDFVLQTKEIKKQDLKNIVPELCESFFKHLERN